MTQFKLPAYVHHWSIVSYGDLAGYLNDYLQFGYEIISVSAYGWLWPRALIVYRKKIL